MAVEEVPTITIPVIDISGDVANNLSLRPQIARDLNAACRSPGFFQIVGHDVPASLQTRVFNTIAQFYALPPAKKLALRRELSGRGYEAIGSQTLDEFPDRKEGFMIGPELPPGDGFLEGPNLWPEESDCPGFRATMEEYFAAMRRLSVRMFRLLATSLDLDVHYFDEFVDSRDSISMCRAHKYPPADTAMAKKSRGVGAHTDFGAMTLLLQDDLGGLEVLHRPTETWHSVPCIKGAYVVNIGDMMERWTNGRYTSTVHRVASPVSSKDRYSVAFFNEGRLKQVIDCIPTCLELNEGAPIYPPVTVEAHLRKRYEDSYKGNPIKG